MVGRRKTLTKKWHRPNNDWFDLRDPLAQAIDNTFHALFQSDRRHYSVGWDIARMNLDYIYYTCDSRQEFIDLVLWNRGHFLRRHYSVGWDIARMISDYIYYTCDSRQEFIDLVLWNRGHFLTGTNTEQRVFQLLNTLLKDRLYLETTNEQFEWTLTDTQKDVADKIIDALRKRDNWTRRWPFVQVLVCHDFQPLAIRRLWIDAMNPPLPTNVPIPTLQGTTLQLVRDKVFTHAGLWRIILSYI